jgi:hypothetical protein
LNAPLENLSFRVYAEKAIDLCQCRFYVGGLFAKHFPISRCISRCSRGEKERGLITTLIHAGLRFLINYVVIKRLLGVNAINYDIVKGESKGEEGTAKLICM